MANLDTVRKDLIAKHKEASFWQRHYEVAFQQYGSEHSQRTAMYYEGLCRGYEVALAELNAVAA